jgi:outer membrane murein-binding lipoprotein Lpp
MATSNITSHCSMCNEEITFMCRGCLKDFCFDHLTEHRQTLKTQFHQIENDYNQFRQTLIDQKNDSNKRSLIQQINKWEEESRNKIKQIADQCRQKLINYTNKFIIKIENKLDNTIKLQTSIREKNEFSEIHLEELKQKLNKLKEELDKPTNISIQQESTSFINQISVILPFDEGNYI